MCIGKVCGEGMGRFFPIRFWGVLLGIFLCAPLLHAQEYEEWIDPLTVAPQHGIGSDAVGSSVQPADENSAAPGFGEEASTPEAIAGSKEFPGFARPLDPQLFKSWFDPWEGNVELGLSGTDGNSETFNVRLGALAKYKTELLHRTLQLTSIQKTANGVTTANTALIDGRLEWPMPNSKWNYFIHSLVEYDQFKAFDYRLSGDTGFGYEFIQNDITTLIGRTGLSTSREFGGIENAFNPELLFGGEYAHKFGEYNKVSFKIDCYPTIDDFSDVRINSQASWEMMLAKDWGLSLKFSLIDRYDSTPHGARPNDLDYSTLLLWSF